MRIAVVSDIHGNRAAFRAVLEDLLRMSPDLVLHGGDLADGGSSPIEIVDQIRDLGWPGVMGNTDEMLFDPDSLENFAGHSTAPPILWEKVREIASATRTLLGKERLAWMSSFPRVEIQERFALVHATPESCWQTLAEDAADAELETIYGPLGRSVVLFGHTHRPSMRTCPGRLELLINTGSVGLPYDGDPRAAYVLFEEGQWVIRRVEYDMEKELKALSQCGLPGAEWTRRMLLASSPQMP